MGPSRWRPSRSLRSSQLCSGFARPGVSNGQRNGALSLAVDLLAECGATRSVPPTYHPTMPVLRSRLDPASSETRANHLAMEALVAELRTRQAALAAAGAGGDERSIARHKERGKLPVRERIDRRG